MPHSFVSNIPTKQLKIMTKLYVNGLEAMQSDINSITTFQDRFNGHLSAHIL